MRVLSIAALIVCAVPGGVLSPNGVRGATIPLWDAGIASEVVVPAGGTTRIRAPGSLTPEALDIALVIDNSGSMAFDTGQLAPGGGYARGDWARDGANAFLDALPGASRVALTKFAGSSTLLVGIEALGPLTPLGPHRVALRTKINGLSRNDSSTNIEAGIRLATQVLTDAGGAASEHIVVVTDGESTSGNPVTAASDALAAGIAGVHTVGLPGANATQLGAVATQGNGQFVNGASLSNLISQFTSILDNTDPFSRLDILSSTGDILIADLLPSSPTAFAAMLDIHEGINRFVARATTDGGAVRTAELTIVGVVIPEPATATLLGIAMAPIAATGRRRITQP